MGWYTNYEVEFDAHVEWDDYAAKCCLEPFNVQHLYLRDMEVPRIMLCVYSHNHIEDVLIALKRLHPVGMCYREYNVGREWVKMG